MAGSIQDIARHYTQAASPDLERLQKKYQGYQEWQIKQMDPEAHAKLFQATPMMGGLMDQNPVTDFLGNMAWAVGEELTLGATLGADIAAGGELKQAFGVQEWADESWAGRIGNIAGQGAGFITGLGFLGKGIQAASKGLRAGSKVLARGGTKKIASETEKALSKILGTPDTKISSRFSEDLFHAGQKAIRTGEESAAKAFGRIKSKNADPFETFDLQQEINNNFDEILQESIIANKSLGDDVIANLLDPMNKDLRDEIRNMSLKTAREYNSSNVAKILHLKGREWGLGDRASQIVGDSIYEATLLGLHGGLRNLSEKFWSDQLDLDDPYYGQQSFGKAVMHGAITGAILAPARYTFPSLGAKVEVNLMKGLGGIKSGVMANVKQSAAAIIRKYTGKKATDYTPKQLQTILRNIYNGSNKNTEFFRGVEGWSPMLVNDVRMLDNAENVKVLQNLYNAVSADISKNLLPMLRREVARDLFESFPRYTIGSLAMNSQNWIMNRDHLTADQVITDYFVGAFYMKRGKVFEGRTPAKRFLGWGDIKGDEVGKLSNAFDALGWDKGQLDYMGAAYEGLYLDKIAAGNIYQQGSKSIPELRNLHDILETDMVANTDHVELIKQPGMQNWATQITVRYTKQLGQAAELRKQGKYKEAQAMELAATEMLGKGELAQIIVSDLNYGVVDRSIRPMSLQDAIAFSEKISGIELNGKKLTLENAPIEISAIRKSAAFKTTANMQEAMENYIKQSLNIFGLWTPAMESSGTIRVHSSVKDGLLKSLSSQEGLKEYSDAIMTLHDVLTMAERTGVIRFDDSALAWTSTGDQSLSKGKLDSLNNEYNLNTERAHDMLFNTKDGGWRDMIPGKRATNDYMDRGILASDPLWKSIETNQLHLRNDIGLQILTGKGAQGSEFVMDIYERLNDRLFKNKRKIVIKDADEASTLRTIADKPYLINLKNNLNRAWSLTTGSKKTGFTEVSIDALEAIHEKLSGQVGDLFSNNVSFNAFKNYLDNKYIDSILGSDATYGAKRAITDLLTEGNPIAFTDPISNRRVIASGKALLTEILGSEYGQTMKNADPDFVSHVRKLVDRYTKMVENPVKDKGSMIEFSDNLAIGKESQYEAQDWYQALMGVDTLLDGSKIIDLTRVMQNIKVLETMNSNFNTAAHFEKLAEVATGRITVEELREAMDNLRLTTRELAAVVTDAIQNNDVVLIREIVDSQYDITRAINRAMQFTKDGKGSIEEVANTIQKVALAALNNRNRRLALDSIESVDEFIKRQTEAVTRKDRAGRPVLESQTISESQYKSKYGIDQTSVDLIKGDLIAFKGEAHDLANAVSGFLNSFPGLKQRPDMFRSVIENLENLGIPAEEYMRQIVKPWIGIQWAKAEALNPELSMDTFLTDTAQILVSSWGQKKISMGNYENGALRISTKSVTNWDAGFLGLIKSLGLENKPNTAMLFSESTIGGNRLQTAISDVMLQEINANLLVGAWPKLARSEIYSEHDKATLDKMLSEIPFVGEGQDGKPQFQVFRLDEKQHIALSVSTFPHIIQSWRNKQGDLYTEFVRLVGKDKADTYLEDKVKLSEFKTDQIDTQKFTTETVQDLLILTRLLNDNAYYLNKYIDGEMSRTDIFKALKYIKLANPRGGITLNKTTVDIMRYFTEYIMPDTPQYADMKRHFASQMNRPQRQMTMYDEGDPTGRGDVFFGSNEEYKAKVKAQYMNERGYTESAATTIANELAERQRPEAKSKVDGEIYLSLPEMTALLVSRGAHSEWFVWDGDRIVGFNTVIKPVVNQSTIGDNGSVSVVVDKTAYKFDPVMDGAMKNAQGDYFTDSIAFKSASKVNQSRLSTNSPWIEQAISMRGEALDPTRPWKPQIAADIYRQNNQPGSDMRVVEIDRANMMLKSISGPHDGTLSMAFGNFLSNPAQDVMNSWLKSSYVASDLNQNMMDLWANPFAFKAIAEKLQGFEKEVGDITSSLTGLEAVLAEGGIPIMEHMRPQIERALVGNYLGARNFASGQIGNGSYSVMTAADGLSHPVRENGMQTRFGGSGIPYNEYKKSVRSLLFDPNGTESISLIFRLTEQQAKDLNIIFTGKLGEKLAGELGLTAFNAGEEIVMSGNGIASGPFDGHVERLFTKLPESREASFARASAREAVLDIIGKDYTTILKEAFDLNHADGSAKIESLGEFVRWLDGNPLSAVDRQKSTINHEEYTVKNSTGSMANKYKYNEIRVLNNDLRTPKDGVNSWVLSGIEKLVDQRRGAVSEMNATDAINPQDSDFDLDKSTSFFATPAPIVQEIHAASGYHEISSDAVWDKAMKEIALEEPRMAGYLSELSKLDRSRSGIIRQHSITSLMYQYFTSLDGVGIKNLLRPGYKTGIVKDRLGFERVSRSRSQVNTIVELSHNYQRYQVMFRHGGEFVDSIGYMKKLIKETIDIYGDPAELKDRNLIDAFWFSDEVGLFKVVPVDRLGVASKEIGWNTMNPEIKAFRKKITDGFLQPLSTLFNLGLGYETLSDGTKRKLSFYDHVSTFNKVKYQMAKTAEIHPELKPFLDEFLGFLGGGNEQTMKSGVSNHPLIDGLRMMSDAHDKRFPFRIERSSELANYIAGAVVDVKSKEIQDAINKYMVNEKEWARFTSLQWEINNLEGILNDMSSRRQHETEQYKSMETKKNKLVELLGEVETIANDKIVQEQSVRRKDGFIREADSDYAVYTIKSGKVVDVKRTFQGQDVNWKAGDIVVENPRTFRFSDPIQQKHLRTMHRAFGNVLFGVEKFDVVDSRGYINGQVADIYQKFRDVDRQFSDATVKNGAFYSDIYTTKLEILKTVFDDVMTTRGPQYAKQLLYSMYTPRVSQNEMSIFNYDNKYDAYYTGFRFRGNKTNEQLVVRFMTAAMDGKVPGFTDALSKEWWKEMEQARKIAYLMTHDRSLAGDAFKIGNMSRGIKPNFNVLPETQAKPKLLDVKSNNEQARKTIQSYLSGSYFLDWVDLYRLTIGLDKGMNLSGIPNLSNMGERVKYLWSDVGTNATTVEALGDGANKAVYRLSRSSVERNMSGSREYMQRKSFSKQLLEEAECN